MSTTRRQFLKSLSIVGGAAALAQVNAPNVLAKKPRRWKMVTTWPKNFPGLGTGANLLAKRITDMSNGELKVRVYGAGELVPAMGVFDAVSRGTAQMGHGASYYWQGKNPACAFFAAVPFGLTAQEMGGWLTYGGGQKLWDDLYADFGLKGFAAGNTGVQMGGWFNKEIKSEKDFKGLKMRMPGLGGKVLSQLGSAVVTLSGGEIFQALQTGTIDATEWVGPYNDLAFGLHKVAKFYYWPGWHEPGTTLECMVNKKAYDELPKHLQHIVSVACQSVDMDMQSEFAAKNSQALSQLVGKHKVKLKRFPDPVLKKLGTLSESVLTDVAKANPKAKKIHASFKKFKTASSGWGKISESAYAQARTLSE